MSNFQAALAASETMPLGKSLCVFRQDSRTLCLLNNTASQVWQALSKGLPDDAVARQLCDAYGIGYDRARQDVSGLICDWQASGLTAMPMRKNGDGERPPLPQQCRAVAADHPGHLNAIYGLSFCTAGQEPLHLKCHEPVLARLLEAVLRPLRNDGASAGQSTAEPKDGAPKVLEVGTEEGSDGRSGGCLDQHGYWIRQPGGSIICGLDRSQARRAVLRQILLQRHGPGNTSAILHASAVEQDGRAIVIAGPSGAGKTALTAALVASGANYLGDDLLALHRDGCQIGDFPASLALKEGSWPLLTQLFPALGSCPTLTTRRLKVRYLDPTAQSKPPAARWCRIAALILPHYQSGCSLTMQKLGAEQTFNGLVSSGSEPAGIPPSIQSLARLAGSVPAWRMHFGDPDAAVAKITRLGQGA